MTNRLFRRSRSARLYIIEKSAAVLSALIALSIVLTAFAVSVQASGVPEMSFCGREDGGMMTLEVSVDAQTQFTAAFFALSYDTAKLGIVDEYSAVEACEGYQMMSHRSDTAGGFVGGELIALPSAVSAPQGSDLPGAKTAIARINFMLGGGVTAADLTADSITLCSDAGFLGGFVTDYTGVGGVLLLCGADMYTPANGGMSVSFDYTPVEEIVSFEDSLVTTVVGARPNPPRTVTGITEAGAARECAVVWDESEPWSYSAAGQYSIAGTADGTPVRPVCIVTVSEAEIVGAPEGYIAAAAGVPALMPDTVDVLLADGGVAAAQVLWNQDDIIAGADALPGQTYAVAGTFSLGDYTGEVKYNITPVERSSGYDGTPQPDEESSSAAGVVVLVAAALIIIMYIYAIILWRNGTITERPEPGERGVVKVPRFVAAALAWTDARCAVAYRALKEALRKKPDGGIK